MPSTLSLATSLLAAAVVSVQSITIANLTTGASCACTRLASNYGSRVLTSSSANYTAEVTDYWDIRADLLPGCVFSPSGADQVADAVSAFTSCGAQFAIRGGGHMNFPGSNNIDGGVLLSLGSLTKIKVTSDNATVEAGPGTRWVDVYSALSEYGLHCIGGRLKTIGVPGLELIGGFHYLINKYGMAMDNAVSYDVVLGNGTQVAANLTSNNDLFWALKGGANNFGIKTLPIPYISTTIQEFNESAVPDFIAATVNMAANNPPDVTAGSVISITYNQTTKQISPSLLGVQEGTESPPSRFANFSTIPVQLAHKTIKPDAEQLFKIYQAWKTAADEISDVKGLVPTFVMNVLPSSALSVAKNNGVGNTWGLNDDQSLILWQLSTGWANAEDDLRMTNWASKLLNYWHLQNQALNLSSEFIYMGDAGEFQDPFTGFPLENIQRMREIRDAYDPLGVFTRLNWGGFKLGAN